MIAKVIAHGRHAARRRSPDRRRAVAGDAASGRSTNREQLIELLGDPRRRSTSVVDTSWLDRSPPADRAASRCRRIAAAALAVAEPQSAARTVLAGLPTGWRNNPSQPRRACGSTGSTARARGALPPRPNRARRRDRRRRRADRCAVGTRSQFDCDRRCSSTISCTSMAVATVFARTAPVHAARRRRRAGSLVAPMPGSVLRVLVAVGDVVQPGKRWSLSRR